MWVLTGPFDGELGDIDTSKLKFLKPDKSYTLGRKEAPLIIRHKRISKEHCKFIVGSHTVDDVSDPSKIPTLKMLSYQQKKIAVHRAAHPQETTVNPDGDGMYELKHGDRIALFSEANIMAHWVTVNVYTEVIRGKNAISREECAALGIKLVHDHKPSYGITHHLLPHYVASMSTAASLLSLARLVKPEWLQEVFRLGSTPSDEERGSLLEDNFLLPPETSYRPSFSPSLLPAQKEYSVWEGNEERFNMLVPYRFLCIREKVTEADTLLADAIHCGGGSLENFDVHQGVTKFRQALVRSLGKTDVKVVIVGDVDSMQTAVGRETWNSYTTEAKICSLHIIPPSKLIHAVLDANASILTESSAGNTSAGPSRSISPLPDRVPNSISDEPSIASADPWTQAPRKPLVRRVTRAASREPSAAPSEPEDMLKELIQRPRKALTKLVRTTEPFITGLDDPSFLIDGPPPSVKPPSSGPVNPMEIDFSALPPRRANLKRRVGVPRAEPETPISGIAETYAEPPLKKFKALFEESGQQASSIDWASAAPASSPPRASQSQVESFTQDDPGSDTQGGTQTQARRTRGRGRPAPTAESLEVLREEEEEVTQSQRPARGTKRSAEAVDDDGDVEMRETGPAAKRRATGVTQDAPSAAAGAKAPPSSAPTAPAPPPTGAPGPSGKAGKQAGAAAGKPDTDHAFLKAIASTKRGKKTEDAFDREFNKLKITKPELERREPEEEWAVLAEFGDDSGLRGNFMTVVEMDVYKDTHWDPEQGRDGQPRQWDGKPNFKKFKKKVNGVGRAKVEVFLADPNDYSMGPGYWKGGNSQGASQSQYPLPNTQLQSQSQGPSRAQTAFEDDDVPDTPPARARATQRARALLDSDDEGDAPPSPSPPPPTKTRKAPAPKKAAAPAKAKAAPKAKAKLFLDSDDDDMGGTAESMTLRSDGESPVRLPTKAKSRGTKAGSGKGRATAIILDDDSDGGFTGFTKRR